MAKELPWLKVRCTCSLLSLYPPLQGSFLAPSLLILEYMLQTQCGLSRAHNRAQPGGLELWFKRVSFSKAHPEAR